eukprot:1158910-Pelagomonas_calceolata.AAC.6
MRAFVTHYAMFNEMRAFVTHYALLNEMRDVVTHYSNGRNLPCPADSCGCLTEGCSGHANLQPAVALPGLSRVMKHNTRFLVLSNIPTIFHPRF